MRRLGIPVRWLALVPLAAIASCNLALGIGGYTFEPGGSGGSTGSTTTSSTTTTSTTSSSTGSGGQDGGQGGQGGGGQGGQGSTSAMPLWSETFGGQYEQTVTALATDAASNVYMTGWFYGTLAFGNSMYTAGSSKVGFVASFDPMGNARFAFFYSASGDTLATAIAVHGDGSFTVGGTFSGTLTPPTGGTFDSPSRGGFLVNYDKTHQARWSAQISGNADVTLNALDDATDGTVTVGGAYVGNLKAMGPSSMLTLPQSPTGDSGYVLQLVGATGLPTALRGFGGGAPSTGRTEVLGVATAGAGPLAIVGTFTYSADLGDGNVYTSGGGDDLFLLRLPDLATKPSVQVAGGSNDQVAMGAAFLAGSALVFGGTFQDNLSFPSAPSATVQGGGTNVFMLGLPPAGAPPVLLTVGSMDGSSEVFGGVAGGAKGAAVAGTVSGSAALTFGAAQPMMLQPSGNQGLFVAKLSPKLDQVLWAASYDDSTQNPPATPVAVAPDGSVYVAGNFQGTLTFGNGTNDLASYDQDDIFLVKFAP